MDALTDNLLTKDWFVIEHNSELLNEGSKWVKDDSFSIACVADEASNLYVDDNTIYFETSPRYGKRVGGFYVERVTLDPSYVVYSHVSAGINEDDEQLYLYKLDDKWIISDAVGSDDGFAYVVDNSTFAHGISDSFWLFSHAVSSEDPSKAPEYTWVSDHAVVYSRYVADKEDIEDVYSSLRYSRSIKFIPETQKYITLRNNIPMPVLGLGTGGLYAEETDNILSNALKMGYKLFDLAREYRNEHVLGNVLQQRESDAEIPLREEIFVESKVWPDHLGFAPTFSEIDASLNEIRTNYIDLYLLHWPVCDPNVEWMHCDTTVDPEGTWRDSWLALEKAYAEGLVMSIGVSNFDADLLDELIRFATVRPHVIQNHAEPGQLDDEVRLWCRDHYTIYQPYASVRNLHLLPVNVQNNLLKISQERKLSVHNIALRFFVQTGYSSVIPRSSKLDHLKENLQIFNYDLDDEDMKALGWMHGHLDKEL